MRPAHITDGENMLCWMSNCEANDFWLCNSLQSLSSTQWEVFAAEAGKATGHIETHVLCCVIQGTLKQQNCHLLGADHYTDLKREILSHLTCHLRRLLLLLVELSTVGTECWSNAAAHQIDVQLLLLWLPKIQNLPSWLYVNDDLFCPKLLCKLYCFLKASRIRWQAHLTESTYSFTAFSHCPAAEVFIKAYKSG